VFSESDGIGCSGAALLLPDRRIFKDTGELVFVDDAAQSEREYRLGRKPDSYEFGRLTKVKKVDRVWV